jgi:NAD(P)-dependent dehydrogenase (short-subunit alcohol dehydrogenase family)
LLRVVFALGVTSFFNKGLSHRVINRAVTDKYDWPYEIVVVTGGSDGFGKHIVLMLAARAKPKIFILDVQEPNYTLPDGAKFYQCHITQFGAVATAAAHIRSDLGGDPTILINNAGILHARPILLSTEDEVQRMFDVNAVS